VPKHNLSMSATYEHKFIEPLIGFIKLNYVHVSGLYVDDENSDKTSSYNLVNSTIGFDWIVNKFQVIASCGINNMFNHTYVAFVNINSANKEFYEASEPRNYFVGINLGYTI
ncbi:MAG TPA: hypothetical protein VFF29_03620, partial [Bacteroidota bacterium]|nr:hypothetical protein [Bacteroidota bacterium]